MQSIFAKGGNTGKLEANLMRAINSADNNYVQKYNKDNFTYEHLTKEEDVDIPSIKVQTFDNVSSSKILELAYDNAISEGGEISNERKNLIANFSTVFKNATKVNESYRDGKYSSVYFAEYLFGNEPYIARFNVGNGSINDIEIFNLYSLGTNKKGTSGLASSSLQPIPDRISIKQLLEGVNSVKDYKNDLPLDVFYKFNENYKNGSNDTAGLKYSSGLKPSDINTDDVFDNSDMYLQDKTYINVFYLIK